MKSRRRAKTRVIKDPRSRDEVLREARALADFERSFVPDSTRMETARERSRRLFQAKEHARSRLLTMSPIPFTLLLLRRADGWVAREPLLSLEASGRTARIAAKELRAFIDEQIELDPIAVLDMLTAKRSVVEINVKPA